MFVVTDSTDQRVDIIFKFCFSFLSLWLELIYYKIITFISISRLKIYTQVFHNNNFEIETVKYDK